MIQDFNYNELINFDKSYKQAYVRTVVEIEGYYTNYILDRGGEQYRGISIKSHRKWKGWDIVHKIVQRKGRKDKVFKDNLFLEAMVVKFYYDNYWKELRCDEVAIVSEPLAKYLFDTGVNMGTTRAIKMLQQSVNRFADPDDRVKVNGVLDDDTIDLVRQQSMNSRKVLLHFRSLRVSAYEGIMRHRPSQKVFRRTWLSRANQID